MMRAVIGNLFLGSLLALVLVSMSAFADPGPQVVPTAAGPAVVGTLTVEGVEYSAETLSALAASFVADPASLPAELPDEVRQIIYRLASSLGPGR